MATKRHRFSEDIWETWFAEFTTFTNAGDTYAIAHTKTRNLHKNHFFSSFQSFMNRFYKNIKKNTTHTPEDKNMTENEENIATTAEEKKLPAFVEDLLPTTDDPAEDPAEVPQEFEEKVDRIYIQSELYQICHLDTLIDTLLSPEWAEEAATLKLIRRQKMESLIESLHVTL